MTAKQFLNSCAADRVASLSLDAELRETRAAVACGDMSQADGIAYLRYAGCFEAEIQEAVGA